MPCVLRVSFCVCVTTERTKIYAYMRVFSFWFAVFELHIPLNQKQPKRQSSIIASVIIVSRVCVLDRVLEVSNLRFELIHLFPFGVDALSFPCLQDVARQVFLRI